MTRSEQVMRDFYARARARNAHLPDPFPIVKGGQSHSDADELTSAARVALVLWGFVILGACVAGVAWWTSAHGGGK